MGRQVLIWGDAGEPLAAALEQAGLEVQQLREPSSAAAPPPGGAVVVVVGPDALTDSIARVRNLQQAAPASLVTALAPRELLPEAWALLAAGAADVSFDPEELASRLAARLRFRGLDPLNVWPMLETAVAAARGGDLVACVRTLLDGAERLVPGAQAAVAIAASRESPTDRLYRVSSHTLEQAILEGLPEAEMAIATRSEVLLGSGGLAASADVKARLERNQAVCALGLPLTASGVCRGALSLLLPEPLEADQLSALRTLATLGAAAVGSALSASTQASPAAPAENAWAERYRELLAANRRLREIGHVKDEFLAICAQDLRSPLDSLLGQARLLVDSVMRELPPQARTAAEVVHRQGMRLRELVEALRDVRAIDSGSLELQRSATDLALLVREVCAELAPDAALRRISLAIDVPADPLVLTVDASRVREVLNTLLGSTLRSLPPGAALAVALSRPADGGALVTVRDDGPAIPDEELPHLFQRYRRRRDSKAGARGSGVSMAVARELVELHGGTVHLDPGQVRGNVLELRLPADRPRAVELARRTRPVILVVEDDPDLRSILGELLERSYDVVLACDGEEGVRAARERVPDLIVMDLFMPRMDGFAAMEDLKRDPRTAETPVILLSAQGSDSLKVRGLNLGAADYLSKPFSGRELIARIERTLRMARQRELLKQLAQTDALTGLANFRAFRARLEEEFKRARRYKTPLACVMLDLDNLKGINDLLGHAVGNRAIATLAQVLKAELRETDFAARYGGDEFVVLLPHADQGDAAVFAERVRAQLLGSYLESGEQRMPLLASFGVAATDGSDAEGADELWRRADAALYEAKEAGRNRVVQARPRQPSALATPA